VDYRPRFAVQLLEAGPRRLTPAGYPRVHYPDAAVTTEGSDRVLAIELERTVKGRPRLRSILHAYIAARQIKGVRYHATCPETARLLAEEIENLHADSLIELRLSGDDDLQAAVSPDRAA